HRERQYDALDQMGQSIFDAGIATNTHEDFPYTVTCSGGFTFNPGDPPGSKFTDRFEFCHTDNRPGGPTCQLNTNPVQTWSVNGIPVGTYTLTYTQSSISIAL